jgi:hypothetical protein
MENFLKVKLTGAHLMALVFLLAMAEILLLDIVQAEINQMGIN